MKTVIARIMGNQPVRIPKTTSLLEISRDYRHLFAHDILLAKVNNEVMELHRTLPDDCVVEFLDITDPHAFRAYQRGEVLLLVCAVKELLGKKTRVVVEHSINKNYYCEIDKHGLVVNDALITDIRKRMHELAEQALPIEKRSLPVEEALHICQGFGLMDKVSILRYRRTANVNLYHLNGIYDYFYGPMVPDTGCLTKFDLQKRGNGLMLQFPSSANPSVLTEIKPLKKMSAVFQESSDWAKILNVSTVGQLNDKISDGQFGEIVRISEALHEKKIAYIADAITTKKKSIVLIAGPSSSGKTTFAERLCIQLRVNGLRPYLLSLDNYFHNRDTAPIGEDGLPDFDSFAFMDVKQLNADLTRLLKGEEVEIPYYNFHTGKREYNGHMMRLRRGDVLVLEGIHALNNNLTYSVGTAKKFKIFISALTQLSIDDHNRIPTSDTRLIRRIVRDYHFRGTAASRTIAQWPSVAKGADENIFPFQEEADAFFNSALIYEMSILKQYAEPLLFRIDKDHPEYAEARRLVKFLDCFMTGFMEDININSILREFIGGSCFDT